MAKRKWKYFKESEFDCPSLPGSGSLIDPKLVNDLDWLRELCGFPLVINSGYRTEKYNKKVGGAKNSAHLLHVDGFAHAVDIRASSSTTRFTIVSLALSLEKFSRVGIGRGFIHLDNRTDLPQKVIWLYEGRRKC